MIKKIGDKEAKPNLQPPFGTWEIDYQYLKDYKPLIKKDKNNTNQKYRDKDKNKDKAKSHNLFFANNQALAKSF